MQFCSYSTWFAPNNAIERTLPLLLPVLIGILMFMLLSDEKHIKKITKNLSIKAHQNRRIHLRLLPRLV